MSSAQDSFACPRCICVVLAVTTALVGRTAEASEPSTLTLGVGALVLPEEHSSMVGPAVSASGHIGSIFDADVVVSPMAMFTSPVEFALAIGLGPTVRIFSPHTLVVGLRGALVFSQGEERFGGVLVAGYAYRGEVIHLEALVGIGLIAYDQVTCVATQDATQGCPKSYFTNPNRYPAFSITASHPLF